MTTLADWPTSGDIPLSGFQDSFEMNMGYVDAFRLWGMSAFDDAIHLPSYLDLTHMPQEWELWVCEHMGSELSAV